MRFEKYDGSVYTFLGDAYLTFGTLIIEKTGGAANRIAATATKDPVTGWIFYEATIEAVEGETLIGAMIQYAPKKGGVTEAEIIFTLQHHNLKTADVLHLLLLRQLYPQPAPVIW